MSAYRLGFGGDEPTICVKCGREGCKCDPETCDCEPVKDQKELVQDFEQYRR